MSRPDAPVSLSRLWLGALLVGLILLPVYLATMAPGLTWAHDGADGGDLATAVVTGGIPHPPGFPTYLILGKLFLALPLLPSDPAWRLNLMSATMAVGAAVFVTMTATTTFRRSLPAVVAGLCLGLAPLFWSQALIAEVYTTAACFTALTLWLIRRNAPTWAVGLAWGLGLGVHPTLLFLLPLVTWAASGGRRSGDRRFLFHAGLWALATWGFLYGPVLWVRRNVPSPWGDLRTLSGWWAFVSGEMYRHYIFGLSLSAWPQRVWAWIGLLVRQFTPPGALAMVSGWLHLWQGQEEEEDRRGRLWAVASTVTWGAISLYALGYDTTDSLVYLLPALPLMALWLGSGWEQIVGWLGPHVPRAVGLLLLLLLPVLQAALFGPEMDLHEDRRAVVWAEWTLRQAPQEAVVLTDQDGHTFALWYLQSALGQRPDVVVLDVDLWTQPHYRRMSCVRLGLSTLTDACNGVLSAEQAAIRAGRPVVWAHSDG